MKLLNKLKQFYTNNTLEDIMLESVVNVITLIASVLVAIILTNEPFLLLVPILGATYYYIVKHYKDNQ